MTLHRCDRHHPLMGRPQLILGFLGGDRARFQQQYAGDYLQAVGDTMSHLAEKGLLLFEQFLGMLQQPLLLLLDFAPLGNVANCEEHHFTAKALVANGEGIKLDGSLAEAGKVLLELETLDRRMLGDHRFQQLTQPRNVPLAIES